MRLVRGGADRKSAFHTPVIASVAANGEPRQRVMVLRKCDQSTRTMRFHTDVRSDKVTEIGDGAVVSVLGYDAIAKIQIRVSGRATVASEGVAADSAWEAANASSRRCYLASLGPGTVDDEPTSGLPTSVEGRVPEMHETEAGRKNFAVMMVTLDALEWLYLAHNGHRRARFVWDDGEWRGMWLIP